MSKAKPIDPKCKECYFVSKVDRQRTCIVKLQNACKEYKKTIAYYEATIKLRNKHCDNINGIIECLPRWVWGWAIRKWRKKQRSTK